MGRKKDEPNKQVEMAISLALPPDHGGVDVRINGDGRIQIFDRAGREVTPADVDRLVYYSGTRKVKHQSRTHVSGAAASVDGLSAIAALDAFYVVDTNNDEIQGVKVSAAFFIACKLVRTEGNFRLRSLDNCGHVYEFHNVRGGNPEMLAILRIANDIRRHQILPRHSKVAFFTDSEMSAHQDISAQRMPLYGAHQLPSGFSMMYVSADTGRDLGNRLMKFCDSQSRKYLRRLRDGAFRTDLQTLEEDRSVGFRYTYYPSLTINDVAIRGLSLTPETRIKLGYS